MEKNKRHEENMKAVNETLFESGARGLGSVKFLGGGVISAYDVAGRILLVHEYRDSSGFEVYTPLTDSMKVPDVLNAIRKYAERDPIKGGN